MSVPSTVDEAESFFLSAVAMPMPERAAIERAVRAHMQPGGVYEVRIPKPRRSRRPLIGYFDDPGRLAVEVARFSGREAEGVYMTLNPVDSALLARAANRLAEGVSGSTDADILRLTRLLIDVDAVRPSGISATEAERRAAHHRCAAIRGYLSQELGWPVPIVRVDSGNGGHLHYVIELSNDMASAALLQRALRALASLFDDAVAVVDRTVFNPSRTARIPGSVAAKGDSLPDRPWRRATATFDATAAVVTVQQLERLAALAPSEPDRSRLPSGSPSFPWDLADVLRASDIHFREKTTSYGCVFVLDACLTDDTHEPGGACFIQFLSGAVAYVCQHNRCAGKGWVDVKHVLTFPDVPRIHESVESHDAGASGRTEPLILLPGRNPPAASPATDSWPVMAPEAFVGLAGDIVQAIDPTTEADPVAVLITTLVLFGSAVGRGPHLMIGDHRHGANLLVTLVGDTATGRKGTSLAGPRRLMELVDSAWATERIQGGLSTGEGLIAHIRDPRYGVNRKGEEVLVDAGVTDKRLLCVEEELAFLLKVAQRQGNTISEVVRRAWDSPAQLRIMTKTDPTVATKPHISILAHITRAELTRLLAETELANGFANRFVWFLVRRSKALPEPEGMSEETARALGQRLQSAYQFALRAGELRHDPEARAAWAAVYPALSQGRPGLAGALVARAAPIVRRLSLVYALLDESPAITCTHLEAALAVWDYTEASVRQIFGELTGDPIADRIMAALRGSGALEKRDLFDLFGRNVSAARLDRAIELLTATGRVCLTRREGDGPGRPATVLTTPPVVPRTAS